jgi:hypothetical protein
MGHRQKSKGRKRPRAWHHTANQDKLYAAAVQNIEPWAAEHPSFTCPDCKAVSYHPEDIREGYCSRCHAWTRE